MEKHPLHIKNPELQTSEEVERAVERKERRQTRLRSNSGRSFGEAREKIPNDPGARIESYMDRLENIFLNPDKEKRERNLEMFRDKIYDELIIKKENFPESYFELQKRIARERGQHVEEIPENAREEIIDVAIKDQRASLDLWMDYLMEEDVAYPAWFKFYVWNQIIKLSQFDKELGKFKSRTESTVGRFPDINRAALAKILDIYEKVKADNNNLKDPEIRENFFKRFPALYAEFIAGSLASKIENKEEVRGKWIKYEGNNPKAADKLWQSVEGKTGGAGWCIEGKATAQSYNKHGDFYVYYTYDKGGNPTQPRLAIQMTGNQIGQIRGILPHQDVEPIFQEVLDDKLKEFGNEADAYRKKSEDMRRLTEIDGKTLRQAQGVSGNELSKSDLIFLYEIDSRIEGFGYEKDPRVAELRKQRNAEEDMLVILECKKDEIARNSKQINKNTKAYLGNLGPGIFTRLQENKIEHIYTKFPENRIRLENLEVGGKTAKELEAEMKKEKINISDYALDIMKNKEFTTSSKSENINLVRLKVKDLGFIKNPTTDEIYAKAKELGLDLCPAEVGPTYRIKYKDQPLGEWVYVGMKPIADRGGDPSVFSLGRYEGGLWLYDRWTDPGGQWFLLGEIMFALRKSS